MEELKKQDMDKVSGGWGKETESWGGFIFNKDELKTLKDAYPGLKITQAHTQSIGVPKDAGTYNVSGTDYIDIEEIKNMVEAKLGEIEYVTHDGKLFVKKATKY